MDLGKLQIQASIPTFLFLFAFAVAQPPFFHTARISLNTKKLEPGLSGTGLV